MNIIIVGDPENVRELSLAIHAVLKNEIIGVNLRDVKSKLPEISCEILNTLDAFQMEPPKTKPKRNKKGKTMKNWQKKRFYD
jgi:hypothetical protein